MEARRAIVGIHERMYDESCQEDWTEHRLDDFDATDLLIETFGDDVDELALFAEQPWESGRIGELLQRDPRVEFLNAEIDPSFDILAHIRPGLTARSPEDEIADAWRLWCAAMRDDPERPSWASERWAGRNEQIAEWLTEGDAPPEALVPLARAFAASPQAMEALAVALSSWDGDPIVGMRATRTLVERLTQDGTRPS